MDTCSGIRGQNKNDGISNAYYNYTISQMLLSFSNIKINNKK